MSLPDETPLQLRLARTEEDMANVRALRRARFGAGEGDAHDRTAEHWMVRLGHGLPLATLRVFRHAGAGGLLSGYTAARYDLRGFTRHAGATIEIGRLALASRPFDTTGDPRTPDPSAPPGVTPADVLRLVLAGLTRAVDEAGATHLLGCTSFAGADPATHGDAFAALARDRLAPSEWQIAARAPETVALGRTTGGSDAIPALLAGYLALGGRVARHGVIDRALGTIHVFTAVAVAAIPERRAARLRALAATLPPL